MGVNVDPLGEALGPSVLPDGLWVLFGLTTGAVVVEPAVLPVVVPLVDEPVMAPPVVDPPAAELPPAEPLCATAKPLESANAAVNAIVVSFIVVSLGYQPKDNSPSASYVPLVFSAMESAKPLARECLCRGDPLLILDWICVGRGWANQASRIAFSKMGRDFSVSEMFPFFGVSEMLPTMFRVEHRTLTADQTHGAVALHVFHCHLPILLARDLSPHFTSESLRLYVRTILRLFSARNKWREILLPRR